MKMNRKDFIKSTSFFSAGIMLLPKDFIFNKDESVENLYELFKNPPLKYHQKLLKHPGTLNLSI